MIIITVHDKVAGTWSPPTVAQNKDSAVRDFRTAVSNPQTIIGQHPDDFELYIVGEWITPYEANKLPVFSAFKSFEFVECGVVKTSEK